MNSRTLVIALALASIVAGGAFATYRFGVTQGMKQISAVKTAAATPATSTKLKPGDIDPSNGKRILYWHDPMAPGQRFDKPGKSPYMDMQLVPVYADAADNDVAPTV